MNVTPTSNNRFMMVLIAVLIAVLLVLALNVAIWISMMGGMMNGRMMSRVMGMNGQGMNDMTTACADMMRRFQGP